MGNSLAWILIAAALGALAAIGAIMKFTDALAVLIERVTPENEREWMVAALFTSSLLVLVSLVMWPELGDNELFKVLAQAVVLQGLLQLAAAFYFTSADDSGKGRNNMPPPDDGGDGGQPPSA